MSWIQNNKFLTALGGGTLVAMVLLFLLGSKGSEQYLQAKEDFDAAAQEAQTVERLPLYPKRENLDGKTKALDEYSQALESLQAAFENYRPQELQNISPEAFTTQLKAANKEVHDAFKIKKTKLPDAFFCGFENYKTSLAAGDATGILDYQLTGIKQLMLALASAGATELKNVHRPPVVEERGQSFTPQPTDVARDLPLEITFKGSENSVRAFLSSIVKPNGYYFVIRSLRIANEKKSPPRTADAKFDKPAAVKPAAAADIFGEIFAPGAEPKPTDEKATDGKIPDGKAPEGNAPQPESPVTDANRILSKVLGDEELQVFLRLDLMQFLPAKKLP